MNIWFVNSKMYTYTLYNDECNNLTFKTNNVVI